MKLLQNKLLAYSAKPIREGLISILLSILIVMPFMLPAQPTTPILTLNSEMHIDQINRISVDAQGRYLVTCSNDKTAKLWDAQTGSFLRTFRIPIAEGNPGLLNAVSISPDGRYMAIGGWSKFDDRNHDVYILNVSTGAVVKRLNLFPNVILDLEYSPTGKYLAVSLGGSNGIRILETTSYSIVKSHTDYNDRTSNIAWDRTGRLAAACYDGKLRLYNSQLLLERLIEPTAGKQLFSVAFSPDGTLLAVGYSDSPQVQVFDAKTLSLLYEPVITEANTVENKLNKVSFSNDGNYLIAGGMFSKNLNGSWWYLTRIWSNKGLGSYTDFSSSKNTVMDIKPLPDNTFIICSGEPDFGKFSVEGKTIYFKAAEVNKYGSINKEHLKVNDSGSIVGIKPTGKNALTFELNNRLFSESEYTLGSPFTDSYAGIKVTDWNTYKPKIDGYSTGFLSNLEKSRSVDISGDGKIVFGADWTIYCTDLKGKVLWENATSANIWCTNIIGNNRAAVTGTSDGTIRWYSMSDGKLILTLYLHPDNKRWVAWTPQGYFDCAPGADNLIGWHLNQGPDREALYYPISKFRGQYYRPDIIDLILSTYNENEAIAQANSESNRKIATKDIAQTLPPVVSIIQPENFQEVISDKVNIEFSATSPNGEAISSVRFMINGRPVETQRGFIPVGGKNTQTITLTIPKQDAIVQVMAENQHGWSVPASVSLKWKGQADYTPDLLKPTLYVLAIGVSDYKNDSYDLKLAAKDARDFAEAMRAQKGGLYKDVVIKILTDANATKNDILDGLDWVQKQTTSRDVAMVFLAGHGVNDNAGTFYFLPHEADLESIRRSCLMFSELKYTASTVAGKVVLYVDACHSGNVMGSNRRAPDINSLVNELSDTESGAVVFTSSTGKQYSLEDPSWGNGAFTKALIEGLSGKADLFGKGSITIKTLDAYIAERVKQLTGGKQSPTAVIPQSIPDFPIAIKR